VPALPRVAEFADELVTIRRDLHAHPEIGFEETRTSGIVAEKLAAWGIEVHRGVGKTGVVGVLTGRGAGSRRIGLRADMDALPMDEETNLPYRSKHPGRFHGCGHDGHTTMLLGAARYLAETRKFAGTVVFIFQPAEEGLGGARAMLADGLFERFPCDEIYALHNAPEGPQGQVSVHSGPMMAGADFFDIRITGRGAHGAHPHQAIDPIAVAITLAQAMQTIVSRNTDPRYPTVVSITQIHAGSAYYVIPESAHLAGTVRTFRDEVRELVRPYSRARVRHCRKLRGQYRGRHPRHFHRAGEPRGADLGGDRSRTRDRRRGAARGRAAAENGQRRFRRHAARRPGRLFLARADAGSGG